MNKSENQKTGLKTKLLKSGKLNSIAIRLVAWIATKLCDYFQEHGIHYKLGKNMNVYVMSDQFVEWYDKTGSWEYAKYLNAIRFSDKQKRLAETRLKEVERMKKIKGVE